MKSKQVIEFSDGVEYPIGDQSGSLRGVEP